MRCDGRSRRSCCLRRSRSINYLLRLALLGLLLLVVTVETVIVDVVNNLVRDVVTDTFASFAEEADLGGRYVILNKLWNDTDVVPELLETDKRIV